jgi:hypothetical protein
MTCSTSEQRALNNLREDLSIMANLNRVLQRARDRGDKEEIKYCEALTHEVWASVEHSRRVLQMHGHKLHQILEMIKKEGN